MPTFQEHEQSNWKGVYKSIDKCPDPKRGDNTPGFTVIQFRNYIRDVIRSKKVTDDEITGMYVELDVDGKQYITQKVFTQEMGKKPRKLAFESSFNIRDVNRDGRLSYDEVQSALRQCQVKDEDMQKFFKDVDADKDGFISKVEFMKMV